MRVPDIRSNDLRSFAEQRVEAMRETRRARKVGTSDLVDIWQEWNEADWFYFRQAQLARAECERLGLSADEQARAVADVLHSRPPLVRGGNTYRPPWTLAIQAEGLCRLANLNFEPWAKQRQPRLEVVSL